MKLLKHPVLALTLAFLAPAAWAQTIPNPSFESNTFTVFPGYVSSNTTITGWTVSPANRVGLNPSGGSPFADNGAIPNGTKVAFVQSTGGDSTLATTITGLTPGVPYRVSFRANSRSQVVAPNPSWSVNGGDFGPFTASPIVGGSNPYYTNTALFTATGPTASLIISNQTAGDSTVLVDDFSISGLATMVVSNTADSGTGSLRDTIAAAPFGAIIGFAPALSGATITLASEIVVNKNIAITASSLPGGITISGGNNTRMFIVNGGQTVTLVGLTLSGGNGFGGFAGAIDNGGTLTLTRCTLSGNTAFAGGALANGISGTLTLWHCTLYGNTAAHYGGAIYNHGPVLTLTHCTLTANYADQTGGGAIDSDSFALLTLSACILAGNRVGTPANTGPDLLVELGTPTATDCLIGDGANSGVANGVNGNIVGTSVSPLNPLLAPLGNYGGPTATAPPLLGSPAIDAATHSTATIDQRGGLRPVDGDNNGSAVADIGAVEVVQLFVSNTDNSGNGSLRQTILNAPAFATVAFAPGLSGGFIPLTSDIVLSNSITINAATLPGGIMLSGGNVTRIFTVPSGKTVSLSGLTFINGNGIGTIDTGLGGAIENRGNLTLTNCSLSGNNSSGNGGAIASVVFGSALTLKNCTLSGNSSPTFGGAIYNSSGPLTLKNCTIYGNSAPAGGGVFSQGGQLTLAHCTLSGNSAYGFGGGGGLYVPSSPSLIANTIIAGNAAAQGVGPDARIDELPTVSSSLIGNPSGSGIAATNGNLINVDARLAPLANNGGPMRTMLPLPGSPAIDAGANLATSTDQRGFPRPVDGDNNGSTVPDIGATEVVQLVVSNANNSGSGSLRQTILNAPVGALVAFAPALSGATITLTNEIVLSNNLTIAATALPAGITVSGGNATRIFYVIPGKPSLISDLTLTAGNGAGASFSGAGGAIEIDSGTLILNRCTLVANSAGDGGVVYNNGGDLTLNQCTVTGNSASGGSGGGIYNDNAYLTVNHSTIVGNYASGTFAGGGGGFTTVGGIITLSNSIVALNNAPINPNIALNAAIFIGANNITDGNPLLASLGNYGGPTRTMPPLAGSPAIDAATNGPIFLTDQRGFPRPVGLAADIGSVEGTVALITATNPPVLRNLVRLANGTFQFSFTNLTGAGFTVFASTNVALPLNQWSNLGPAIESPAGSGQFQFSDPQAANNPRRYYRVKSP